MQLRNSTQQPAKTARIGVLSLASGPNPNMDIFQGLRELGWIEGKNMAVEYRWAAGREDRLAALATELVRLKVDVIVTLTSPAALAAKQATTTIPVDQHDVVALRGALDERRAVVADDAKARVVGRHEEAVAQRDHMRIDLDRGDVGPRQMLVAVLGERAAAEPDHQDARGLGLDQREAHHRSRVVELEHDRVAAAHSALDRRHVEIQRGRALVLIDEGAHGVRVGGKKIVDHCTDSRRI